MIVAARDIIVRDITYEEMLKWQPLIPPTNQ